MYKVSRVLFGPRRRPEHGLAKATRAPFGRAPFGQVHSTGLPPGLSRGQPPRLRRVQQGTRSTPRPPPPRPRCFAGSLRSLSPARSRRALWPFRRPSSWPAARPSGRARKVAHAVEAPYRPHHRFRPPPSRPSRPPARLSWPGSSGSSRGGCGLPWPRGRVTPRRRTWRTRGGRRRVNQRPSRPAAHTHTHQKARGARALGQACRGPDRSVGGRVGTSRRKR